MSGRAALSGTLGNIVVVAAAVVVVVVVVVALFAVVNACSCYLCC